MIKKKKDDQKTNMNFCGGKRKHVPSAAIQNNNKNHSDSPTNNTKRMRQ